MSTSVLLLRGTRKQRKGWGAVKQWKLLWNKKPCNQYTCFFSNYFSCDKSCHQQNGYGIWIIACKHNAFCSGFCVSLCVANQKFKACVLSSVNQDDVRRYSACNNFGLKKYQYTSKQIFWIFWMREKPVVKLFWIYIDIDNAGLVNWGTTVKTGPSKFWSCTSGCQMR